MRPGRRVPREPGGLTGGEDGEKEKESSEAQNEEEETGKKAAGQATRSQTKDAQTRSQAPAGAEETGRPATDSAAP